MSKGGTPDAALHPPVARGVRVEDPLRVGFTHRLGLVHVDFETQVRTLKSSADFYRTIIRTHGAHLDV